MDEMDTTAPKAVRTELHQSAKVIEAQTADGHVLHHNTADDHTDRDTLTMPARKAKEKVGTEQIHTERKVKAKDRTTKVKEK